MRGGKVPHSGGNKLAKDYSPDQIRDFYVLWAFISGCPVLAERELRKYHLTSGLSPKFRAGGEPKRNRVCTQICIPQKLKWSVQPS